VTHDAPRVAVVTGGIGGIGSATAHRLRADGLKAVVVDMNAEGLAAFTERTGIAGHVCDVADFDVVQRVFAEIEAEHGPIGVLINNAGITRDGMLHKMSPERWQAVMTVNLTSVFNATRTVLPGMRERRYGRIVSISSLAAQRGNLGQANYSSAKGGIIAFTKTAALESAGHGITVNCIAPGFILTDMTRAMPAEALADEAKRIPVGRLGAPEDIAAAIAFLVRDEASFVTGQCLAVNGGQYM
jgi:acetoacetyl-CoA reductase